MWTAEVVKVHTDTNNPRADVQFDDGNGIRFIQVFVLQPGMAETAFEDFAKDTVRQYQGMLDFAATLTVGDKVNAQIINGEVTAEVIKAQPVEAPVEDVQIGG